ncbi:MAG: hypothetical protein EOO23_01675 [Comamonadaceae bacterium]|nr:MAG: hypothetical protein EOO23_01675 [Comamonadaceae bacterium]
MKRMDEDDLLGQLQALEEDSSAFTWGRLGRQRERNMREYFRMPYGNEQDGLSSIVTSEVQDTIEWILPDLLDIFTSTDKAVVFEPTRAEDVKGAEQATDACNYVFYKQNNGFLNLYTAFKDALQVKNCAVMWRKEKRRTKVVEPVNGASMLMLSMLLQEAGDDAELEGVEPIQPQPIMSPAGPLLDPITQEPVMSEQLYKARISRYEEKTTIKVEAFPPEDLLVKRDWTTPLLADCPYVCRNMPVTLSELHEMGFKNVAAEDLDSSDEAGLSADGSFRQTRAGTADDTAINQELATDDEAMTRGYLRIEFVLVDYDGDGIAERRCIYRLKDKILSNEECADVPIATASPILIQHRWDGMSIAEAVSDLQVLSTELTRQMIDSGRLALNPRTKVMTDAQWAPMANIDDLLDSRAGGIVRMKTGDAVQEMITPWVGGQMFPMLEYKDSMLEKRTGVSPHSQGLDPNSLNRGGAYETKVMNAAKMRIKLIARVFAEVLMKPVFQGILKLLTDGEMQKISMRLRGEFVEYDPNEWRDSYDMTSNVGLGTGDTEQQTMVLQAIAQSQAIIAQSPWGKLMVSPKQVYNTQAKLVENAGFKNVGDFFLDPGDEKVEPPQPPPDPQIQIAQMKLQADAQKFQATSQQEMQRLQMEADAKLQEVRANLELQAANDGRDSQRQANQAEYDYQLELQKLAEERYKTDQDNATRIRVAEIQYSARLDSAQISSETSLLTAAHVADQQAQQTQQGFQP